MDGVNYVVLSVILNEWHLFAQGYVFLKLSSINGHCLRSQQGWGMIINMGAK